MPDHDIIVVGASAGGVEALIEVVRALPPELPAAVFVVMHFPETSTSVLPDILGRRGRLPARHARDDEAIEPGRIYVAAPNSHLLVKPGRVKVVAGPRENGHRPAIDPLFRTASRSYGRRVIGVILSGALDDGTAGLQVIKAGGGLAVIQDPADALSPAMPQSAIDHVAVDHVLPLDEIGPALVRLAKVPAPVEENEGMHGDQDLEPDVVEREQSQLLTHRMQGTPSTFTCPECGGALWEHKQGDLNRFRCHVGHGFSEDSLLSEQVEALESALWTALRTLEQTAEMARRMAERAHGRGHHRAAERFEEQATDTENRAATIRHVLHKDAMLTSAANIEVAETETAEA